MHVALCPRRVAHKGRITMQYIQQYSGTVGTAAVQQICCTSTAVQSVQLDTPMSAAGVLQYSNTAVQQYSSSTAVQQTAEVQPTAHTHGVGAHR